MLYKFINLCLWKIKTKEKRAWAQAQMGNAHGTRGLPRRDRGRRPLTLLERTRSTRCCQLGPGDDGQGPASILDPRPGPCQGCTARRESVAQPLSGSPLQLRLLGGRTASRPRDPPHSRVCAAGGAQLPHHLQANGGFGGNGGANSRNTMPESKNINMLTHHSMERLPCHLINGSSIIPASELKCLVITYSMTWKRKSITVDLDHHPG